MKEIILETFHDTIITVPFLFIVYLLIEVLQSKINAHKIMGRRLESYGPLLGAGVGCIPQCGFSAASAALYNERLIGGGTLVAVFLSTSDEAIPVILANMERTELVLYLIFTKLIIAVLAGYILKFTVFRKEVLQVNKCLNVEYTSCENKEHHEHKGSVFTHALYHTLKISVYILITLFIINMAVHGLGEERLSAILLSNSPFQPLITALIGIIPGCTTSVLITELLLSGSITFGSAIAGLGTGAGFGYIVLFKGNKSIKKTFKIIALTYLSAAISGVIINLLPIGI